MSYAFEPYRSPFANSIAETIARRGDIAARRAEQIGAIQGQAAQQSGQGWANALLGASNAVAAIPTQIQIAKRTALQDEATKISVDEAKQKQADRSALDAAYKLGSRDQILASLPGHLVPSVTKQFADADAAAGKLQKTQAELDKLNNEYLAGLGASVAEHGYDLTATGIALQHARNTYEQTGNQGMLQRIDAIAAQLSDDPNSVKQIVDGVIQLSPERAKMLQTERHQTAQEEQSKTVADETARHNAAMETIQTATGDRAAANAAETARHNREMERLRGAQIAQGEAAPSLSPEALALTAHQYAMTGQLPPMGMGKQGAATRAAIINEAAKVYKNLDLPSQQAAYKANQESLKKLQGQRDAIGAFEETALKNLDVFLEASKKVIDTGSPWLNQPLRSVASTGLGSADQAAFETARRTVIPEFAKILANPGLSGQLSDAARKEVEDVVKGNATMKQIVAAANVLKTDTANRRTSYDDQIKAIQQRIATPPGQTAAPATTAPKEGTEGNVNGVPAVWKTVNGVTGWYKK